MLINVRNLVLEHEKKRKCITKNKREISSKAWLANGEM